MTSDEVYKLIEDNGLTLHGDIEHFATLVASAEREACAEIADRLPRIYRETQQAHYRLSPEPFKPERLFDLAELRQAEKITQAIRARDKHD